MGAAWAGMVLFDITIFALTVYRSLQLRRMGRRMIIDVMLRDGKCSEWAYQCETLLLLTVRLGVVYFGYVESRLDN